MKERKEMVKPSAAIQISNDITLLQRKAWNLMYTHAYDDLATKEVHSVSVKALRTALGLDRRNDKHLRESLRGLVATVVEWNLLSKDKTVEWGATALLSQVKIRGSVCSYAYGPELRERLQSPAMYARISLEMQKQFDSKHALALYELFKDYLIDARNYGETPFIALTTFHKLMGISESFYSASFKKLNQDVIKPAVKDINAKTDLNVQVETKKEGRRIVALKFKIRRILRLPKQPLEPEAASKTEPTSDANALVEELMAAGMKRHDALHVWQQGFNMVNSEKCDRTDDFEGYVREKLHLLKSQPAGKVKNPVGFLMEAIKENYTNAQFQEIERSRVRESNKMKLLKLERERDGLFSERRAAVHEVCGEIIAGNPGLVEELLTALLEAKAEYRRWYRPEQSPVENYQRTAPLTSYVDEQLVQRYPGRFETIQQMYQPKIEAVEQEIGKLKGRTTG